MKIKISFTEPLLGTLSGNKEIAEEFIISKHPDGQSQEELDAIPVDETIEKSSTIFARNPDGKPMLWDYQIKGFFKEACAAMIHIGTLTQEELKKVRLTQYLYKKTIDEALFVKPRQIPLELPNGDPLKFWERPLRGETMRGERICLARSEMAPIDTVLHVEVIALSLKLQPYIEQWLTYGALKGLGQWRNSGCGRFTWEMVAE